MRRVVYVDAGAWIALVWSRDRAHRAISEHFRSLRLRGDLLVTSDPALGETVTRLRYDAGLAACISFQGIIEEAIHSGGLRLREINGELRHRAFEILARHADLRLSYADCIGAAVAEEVRAGAVFGLDHDFRLLGFVLEP